MPGAIPGSVAFPAVSRLAHKGGIVGNCSQHSLADILLPLSGAAKIEFILERRCGRRLSAIRSQA